MAHPVYFDRSIAVVTGVSSGIGRRVALDLARRGAVVVGLARRAELLAELEFELKAFTEASAVRVCDVSDREGFAAALRQIESERGRIDILINNAGVHQTTPAEDGFSDGYDRIFDTNFFGVVNGTLCVLPGMLQRGSGIVVNVSSDSARAPEPREAAYGASKAAVSAFTESIAHEVAGTGVSVHVLYPAWVPTAMGMGGVTDNSDLPPKAVRRTDEQVSALLLDHLGGKKTDINAAFLPKMAVLGRSFAPVTYQKAMRGRSAK